MLQIFHKLRCIAKRYIILFYVIIYIYILQKKDNIACKEVWYFKCKELPLWYKMLIICSRHLYKILISRHQLKKYNYWQWLRSWSFYVRTYIWKKIYMETPLVLSDSYMQKWDPPPIHVLNFALMEIYILPVLMHFLLTRDGLVQLPSQSTSHSLKRAKQLNKYRWRLLMFELRQSNIVWISLSCRTYTTSHARLYHNKRTRYYSIN